MEINSYIYKARDEMLEIFEDLDKRDNSIYSIHFKFYSVMSTMHYWAKSEEEKAFIRECEIKMIPYYQRALERHYQDFKKQKELGIPDYTVIDSWTLTLDKDGNPTKTRVVDVQKGLPVYADGCVGIEIGNDARAVGSCRHELRRWLESNRNLYELRIAAKELRGKGPLGMSEPPTPNYDLDGLVGGQLDAAAWQNYAIENGMVPRTDYDKALDRLLDAIDKCIDFYEKAISIV